MSLHDTLLVTYTAFESTIFLIKQQNEAKIYIYSTPVN